MNGALTNIQQGDTQDNVFNCETQEYCVMMVAPMKVRYKKLHPSMQMTRECQGLPKTKKRNLKHGQH
jgi:hypothetical protein